MKVALERLAELDELFAPWNHCHRPGVAVGIALHGKPVYRRGFGLANADLPLVLSPATRMRIASVTKQFTCLACLLLCEEGKASLEDPIGKYLPELNEVSRRPTLRQLMGHVSGLRDACDWFFHDPKGRVSGSDILAFYRDLDEVQVNAPPGSTWRYNDGAYLLLGLAIERMAGQALEEFLCQRIFEPIGMHDSLLCRWDTDFIPHSAALHMTDSKGGFRKAFRFIEGLGQGGIVSTVDDLLRWLAHMDHPIIGGAVAWKIMATPQILANGTSTGYGLGLAVTAYRGIETLWHSGMVMGGRSQMLKVPAAALDIVVLTNRHDVAAAGLAQKALDICLPDLEPIKLLDAPIVTGTFRSPVTGRVIQLFGEGEQQIAAIDAGHLSCNRSDAMLRPAPISSFRKQAITFPGDPRCADSIHFNDFGAWDELVKVNAPDRPDTAAIVGHYGSGFAGTQATITVDDSGPRLRLFGPLGSPTYRLECLAQGIWRARSLGALPLGGILVFDTDARAFHLTTPATWRLGFQRIT